MTLIFWEKIRQRLDGVVITPDAAFSLPLSVSSNSANSTGELGREKNRLLRKLLPASWTRLWWLMYELFTGFTHRLFAILAFEFSRRCEKQSLKIRFSGRRLRMSFLSTPCGKPLSVLIALIVLILMANVRQLKTNSTRFQCAWDYQAKLGQ